MTIDITLRAITDDDHDFLCALYGSTREDELAAVPWTREQKDVFIKMQFHAQHIYYTNPDNYPNTSLDVILLNGQPVGRLYINRWPDDIRVMDIALLPEYRKRGIGTALIQQILDEAREKNARVSLYVESFNPAYRLYERFGFHPNGTNGVYTFMEWR